ncbi:methyl-CpG-binding domain-containing protein 9 [Cornus florida]|uniref:methyl-CpG-binding domain-containing protein 9 n=1 Tax=Cornus florida TaxID=4283 RepID=UPI00289C30BD|nr:methyl-CpG-binding domain-containing protein 9 [Cornus florida]
MELADSKPEQPTRSSLAIDLNEIPSSSSSETLPSDAAFDFVRAYHDHPTPPAGAPAEIPGDSHGSSCGACGRPEVVGKTVVCDGCERGFHLGCSGLVGREAVALDEWLCGECVSSGVSSSRWPLGSKKRRIMNINASPPNDGEDEGTEELPGLRKHTPDDNSFGGNPFGAPVAYSNLYAGNEFGLQKESGIETHTAKLSFEDILQHSLTEGRSSEEVDMHSLLGRFRSNNHRNIKLPPQHLSKMYLQALGEFVFQRNGVLEEGWHVEFRTSINSGELHAVYCAPNGKIFESLPAVACYLGLTSNRNSVEPEVRSDDPASLQRRLHLPKIQKSAGLTMANGVTKNNGTSLSGSREVPPFDFHTMDQASEHGNNVEVMEITTEENSSIGPQQLNDGLPVQYEDLFVLSLGKIDTRLSYHTFNQIWPIGYRSCWHDKITGSLFMCDVSDGGNSGPIFKVRRCSCSALSIPDASTVLYRSNCCQNKEENDEITSVNVDYDEDCIVQMILSDPSPPLEHDILSCLGSYDESNVQTSNRLQLETGTHCERFGNLLSDNLDLSDDVGDFSVEESSSSSAWRMMSKKFIEMCREFYVKRGTLKFFCKHVENRTCSAHWVSDGSNEEKFASLAKLCCSFCSFTIPSVIQDNKKLETVFEALVKWLDQDRFGLDVEFVQQFVERLPGILACSQYVLLKERSNSSSSVTVGNGLLLANTKGGVQASDEEALDGLFRGSKQNSMQVVEDPVMKKHCLPPGKPISSRLPCQLVGDVLQVWELLLRFFEFLGLREPLSFEELEKELISPWSDGSCLQEKLGGEFHNNQDIFCRTNGTGGHIISPRNESGSAVPVEGPHEFIQIKTGVMKEAAQARMTSVSFSKCTGFTLTKAHCSLLKVLISELLSKVAAIVDPNFDTGEPKSKRGKKKDIDCSTAAKRTKVNVLPINELTWPELARRYVLAILSMDGNFDSAELTISESSKVFHCLQGDGGVLCGSLTGVVGMEADAVLLAEATKKIFGSLNRDKDILTFDDGGSDGAGACERSKMTDDNIPEWAQLLEPVKKLPTNVGARIRKCVYDALEKGPPEWAKKILEHSISKEVYKGNASGPTKKAIISVLADVYGEGVRQKPDRERKRTIHISISDIIMKQCRIVLRRAAAADDAKVFCNLLGKKLISNNDNDDEGILGSPAMVSRPLDFRTIDLRLAAGAYDGSHEAFLEDVRELWTNIRIAHCDRPDMVQLAEALLNNFESLYEEEVVRLFQKLVGFAKSKCLSADSKKEINDFLVPASELPKAPWEEGVCKICGIDKDDDSVLLCDTCDAEYHTYCLNPPLARIPKGNWYCPSCVAGKHMVQDASECTSIICEDRKRKHGEVSCLYLDALRHLAVVMEEREYWEFSVDERIFLLNILCDELLNTTLIHQHLEHCAKESADLQQKLRSLFVEWKNLKQKEEILAAEVAIIERNFSNAVGNVGKEGPAALANNGKCSRWQHVLNDGPDFSNAFSEDVAQLKGGKKGISSVVSNKYPSANNFLRKCSVNSQITDCMDVEHQSQDVQPLVSGSHLLVSNLLQQETADLNRENSSHCDMQKYVAMDVDTLGSSEDLHGNCLHLDTAESSHTIEHVTPTVMNDSHANSLELLPVMNEISILQDSITSIKKQLLKLSLRREFLGSDSAGRLYWVLAKLDTHPWVIVSGSMAEQQGDKMTHLRTSENCSVMRNSAPHDMGVCLTPRGSGAFCPFTHEFNDASSSFSPWVFYQSDAEIKELVECLKDNDPQERELKESILHWQKVKFQDTPRSGSENQNGLQIDSEKSRTSEKFISSNRLVTKAARLLETKYGPCFEPDAIDFVKKRGRKAKFATEDKMFRCECLEPVWPSRCHCFSCHRTFFTDDELEGHNNAKCNAVAPVYEKSKENSVLKGKGKMKSENAPEECIGEINTVETSKSGCSGFSSSLIKYQNDGLVCPYDFEDICSKFVIKSTNKELVQEIGLIGSKGIPSFLPTVSPYLSDSTLMLIPPERDLCVADDELEADEYLNSIQGNNMATNEGHGNISDNFPKTYAANECSEALENEKPAFCCLQQIDNRMSSCGRAPVVGVSNCCIVPKSSLRPLIGKPSQILRQLKINLLDMDAALPDAALRPSKAHLERRWAWRAIVKSAETIYEMVQAIIIFENMIKAEYLRNVWWYWSSLSAAAKISTLSSLALRLYSLDAAVNYENVFSNLDPLDPSSRLDQSPQPGLDATEKSKFSRKTNKKRKEAEG